MSSGTYEAGFFMRMRMIGGGGGVDRGGKMVIVGGVAGRVVEAPWSGETGFVGFSCGGSGAGECGEEEPP